MVVCEDALKNRVVMIVFLNTAGLTKSSNCATSQNPTMFSRDNRARDGRTNDPTKMNASPVAVICSRSQQVRRQMILTSPMSTSIQVPNQMSETTKVVRNHCPFSAAFKILTDWNAPVRTKNPQNPTSPTSTAMPE